MNIIFFSTNYNIVDEWKMKGNMESPISCFDIDSLNFELKKSNSYILIADYDSVASEVNNWISSDTLPQNIIILEKAPEIITGKMLISHGIKAYGNSRMLSTHYSQMIETVLENKIWTYPELTVQLVKMTSSFPLNNYAKELIENRLSKKEEEVVYMILEGLTNNAIASKLNITTRTVKAHIGAIFTKLHINDRVSLILLLK